MAAVSLASVDLWGRFLEHLQHLRSPLGAGLLAAAAGLLLAMWLARHRRGLVPAHRLASAPGRGPSRFRSLGGPLPKLPHEGGHRPAGRLLGWWGGRHRSDLVSVLAPYRLVPGGPRALLPGLRGELITLSWLRKLSSALEDQAGRAGFGQRVAARLERAGVRAGVGEALSIWLLGGLVLVGLGFVLAGWAGSLALVVLALVAPPAVLQGAADHRARQFASQLPDVLKLTASSLRAGFSLLQGLDAVSRQLREPSATELQRALAEARLGRPVEDALEAAAGRVRNQDFSESVAAVRIQQEAGGNLAALFDTLAETMVQRLRLRREVRTLTAEGRLSAYVLGAMPLLLGLFIFAVNRAYMLELLHSFAGKAMLLAGLVLQVVGFYWMYRIVKIET